MSEYQYHEWQTVDRLLTSDEQAAVDDLSSHIEVSPSRAVVTYNWGDFKYDPKEVLLQFFDAYFYLANWGNLRLMFRFPKGLLNTSEIERYCDEEFVSFESYDEYQVLDIHLYSEGGPNWDYQPDATLSDFIHLRADLLEGDYRLLYLAWLLAKTNPSSEYSFTDGEYDDDDYDEEDLVENEESEAEEENEENEDDLLEPPVPAGLKKLSPALENFVEVFGIDPFLVKAAAEASPDLYEHPPIDYRELVSRLSRAECDNFLVRLAEADAGAGLALRKRLKEFIPKKPVDAGAAPTRSLQQLLKHAEQLETAEQERLAEQARQNHIAEMKALAQKEPQVWRQVEDLLAQGSKSASVYDQATSLLEKLKQLADFQDTRDLFFARVQRLAAQYASRHSLISRWKLRGWV